METYNPPSPLTTQVQQVQNASDELSRQEGRKSRSKKYLFLLVILIVLGIGIFLISKGLSSGNTEATPTPTSNGIVKSASPRASTSPTPEANVDKATIAIEIQNGTGIPKEASFLQAKLEPLGYKKITSGNADNTDYENAIVTFSKDIPTSVVDEITKLLESTYKKVEKKTATSGTNKITIITGLRTGQTPKASATATPKPSGTATPTPTPTSSN